MTAFVQINGFVVGVKGAARVIDEPGMLMSRSVAATLRKHRRAIKTGVRIDTVPLTEADAEMLEGLILGLGYSFHFDSDLYSALTGLGPNAGYAGVLSDTSPMVGTRSLYLTSGQAVGWSTGFTGDYSIMAWCKHDSDGWTVRHRAYVYDADAASGVQYKNSAVVTEGVGYFTMASGLLTMLAKDVGGSAAACNYDDLVVVPYKLDAETIAWHYNGGTPFAFPDLPRLSVTGDVFKSATPKTMIGNVGEQPYVHGNLGSFAANNRSLSIELFEV